MQTLQRRSDTWLGVTLLLSTALHVAAFFVMVWLQRLSPDLGQVQTTYYVDMVNLPVASPQSGSPIPTPTPAREEVATAPQAGPTASVKAAPKAAPMAIGKSPSTAAQSFQERLASLAGKAAEERQAAALASIREKVAGGRAGMPGATGAQAGSDYTAYLHSRLKDAFRETISYQSRAPFVAVRLTIDGEGRIVQLRLLQSSGDKVFENAVQRAISLAQQRIVPPPGHTVYQGSFVFKPQGVTHQ